MTESTSADGDPASGSSTSEEAGEDGTVGRVRREVVVPDEVYRVVTVFSTLLAVLLVVAGMVALDAANRGAASREDVDLLVAAAGVGAVAGGAAVYAFAARFRAAGMGNAEGADDETSE